MANNNIHWNGGGFNQNYQAKTYNPASYSTILESGDLWNDTIYGKADKYQIDLFGSMMTWNTKATPLLSLLYNMATESAAPPVIIWADEYKGESWFDIKLDNARRMDTATTAETYALPGSGYGSTVTKQMHAVTSSNYVGGRYEFNAGVLNSGTLILAKVADEALTNVAVKDSDGYYKIVIPEDVKWQGKVYEIYNAIRQYVMNLGYTNSGDSATKFTFNAVSTSSPVYFAWDEVHFAKIVKSSFETGSFHEVLMRLEEVEYIKVEGIYSIILTLNPAMSNESIASYTHMLTSVVATDTQLLQVAVQNTVKEYTAGDVFGGMISRPSRMMQIGQNTVAPQGVPDGDIFRPSGNITASREARSNLSQIFVSPKYGITGTHAASKFRFGDDFANTRAFYLEEYKKSKVAAYLTGVKGETFAVNNSNTIASNQPVRTLGGMLDYALFPITYMKKPFRDLRKDLTSDDVSSVKVALKLSDWFDSLTDSLFSFRGDGSENLTLLASSKFLSKLDLYVRSTMNDPYLGGRVMIQKPSQVTFGLEIYTFKTSKGHNVTFIHEPALDYMVQFPVAYHMFGTGHVDAKDILLSIDTAHIKQVICRPDKLEGGIQDIGQDAFLEAMRGESSFLLRNPKNHAIVWVPDEA